MSFERSLESLKCVKLNPKQVGRKSIVIGHPGKVVNNKLGPSLTMGSLPCVTT